MDPLEPKLGRRLGPATRAIHKKAPVVRVETEALAPDLVPSTSFAFDDLDRMDAVFSNSDAGYAYSRVRNPTVAALEETVADLEGGEAGVAFASGMAAIHGALSTVVAPGHHLVAPRSVYGGTHALLTRHLARQGVQCSFVPVADREQILESIQKKTRAVFLETLANPSLDVPDVPRLTEALRDPNIPVLVDSTLATPALARPLEWGADLVIHSASKYLGGHGDLLAGVVVGSKARISKLRRHLLLTGGACSPFAAWLVLRGLKSLWVRMERHSRSAAQLADLLAAQPQVQRVLYPTRADAPTEAVARRLLPAGAGGVLSLVLAGGDEAARRFVEALLLFKRAASLGDAHSLVMLPRLASHRSFTESERRVAGIVPGFVRLSVGLEDPEDLAADLLQALAAPA